MGHLDDNVTPTFTVTVRHKHGDGTPEVFNGATDVNMNEDEIEFQDRNGKQHTFFGSTYHVAEE